MKRIAILGLGLMGGSLGLAIKARRLGWHVAGYTRTPARGRRALQRGAVDSLHATPAEAVAEADLVVLCGPVLALAGQAGACRGAFKPGCVVTDVGSTKTVVEADLVAALAGTGAVFVGSHPLCGSEQQGIDAARADLYEGALVFVSAPPRTAARAVKAVSRFWQQVGGRVVACTAREHDRVVARTSHLPHMVASLLAVTVARTGAEKLGRFCGSGFADTSRVAEGSPDVWHDIVRTNRSNLADELRAYTRQTERLIRLLDDGDFKGVQRFLEQGQAARRLLLKGKPRKDV